MAVIDIKKAKIYFRDGSTNSIQVKVGDGTLTYDEKRTIEYLLERGLIDEVREGDQVPMDVSFNLRWEHIMSDSGDSESIPSLDEVLKQLGAASGWVSSDTDSCRPYAVDVVIVYTPTCDSEIVEQITLPDFRWETLNHDLKAATIACSGKCNSRYASVKRGNQYT